MPNDFIAALFAAILTITTGATATEQAVRGEQTQLIAPPPPAVVEPEGLTGCDLMRWHRIDVGLPAYFDGIVWRESNCRAEPAVRTWCCVGPLQLYISLHLRDHRLVDKYHACGVFSESDVNGPEDVARHYCAAKALHSVVGDSAWSATR
ncbi:hypothetical protein [Gemmatimonas sp.]|uniref:hypothetical protein n=1 Tax=Gemmatimonas sp. TaxID=1962908 RepID=UPI003564E25A